MRKIILEMKMFKAVTNDLNNSLDATNGAKNAHYKS